MVLVSIVGALANCFFPCVLSYGVSVGGQKEKMGSATDSVHLSSSA